MSFSNAQLAQKISDLIDYWSSFSVEYADWLGGTVDGGPNLDGEYPLTDYTGTETLVKSPAKLQDDVDNITTGATAQANAAAASAAAALTSENNAATSEANALSHANDADADRVAAGISETNATNAAVTSTTQANLATDRAGYAAEWANKAEDSLISVAAGGDNVDDYSALHWSAKSADSAAASAASAAAALVSENNAAASAAAAATFDPALFAALADNETITGNYTFQMDSIGDFVFRRNGTTGATGVAFRNDDAAVKGYIGFGDDSYFKIWKGVDTSVVFQISDTGNITQVGSITATGAVTGSNLNVSNWDTAYSWGNHAGLYSLTSHNHAGVYEPADATILKDADIGVTVAAFSHSHSDYLPNTGVATHGGDIDFNNILGDRITLWGTHDGASSYAIGIESGTMYFKGDAQYRWYFDVNADDGASDTLELTPTQLTLTAPGALGDVRLIVEGDSDNAVEGSQAEIWLAQDGRAVTGYFRTTDTNGLEIGSSTAVGTFATPVMQWSYNSNVITIPGRILGGTSYGTAGNPTYSSGLDANTGMYISASDILGFSTGGIERVKIDFNGLTMVAAGADLILGNNSLTAENISSSVGAAPLKIGTGTGSPMVWGQYCALGRTYSAARTGLANNAYVDSDDAVSGQWRHLVTHGSYGHTILELAGGAYYFYGNSDSVTSGAVVSKNQIGQLDPLNGFRVASTGNTNPGAGWAALTSDMLHLDGKEALDGNDTYLRLNQNLDYTSGVYTPGVFRVDGGLKLNADCTLSRQGSTQMRVQTAYGYTEVGPNNTSWAHFNTDRANFYFNKGAHFAGQPKYYNLGAIYYNGSSSYGSGKVTYSTSAATGGTSGDIWYQYT